EHLARAAAIHWVDGESDMTAEVVVEERGERSRGGLHATPASARSSSHFACAAGTRLGMCSLGQPVTGVNCLRSVRATTVLCTSSGPSPMVPNLVPRYEPSTGRSPE